MARKITVALSLLLLAAAAIWLLGGSPVQSAPGATSDPAAVTPAAPASASGAAVPPSTREEAAPPADATQEPLPTTGELVVHVAWKDGGAAAAGVGLTVLPAGGIATLHARQGVSDAQGSSRFPVLPPGDYTAALAFEPQRLHPVSIAAGRTSELQLQARRHASVRGTVVDDNDRAVAEADIWVSEARTSERGQIVGRSGADGTFAVPLGVMAYVGARKPGFAPSHLHAVLANEPRDVQLTLRLRGRGGSVRGKVLDQGRQPIAGAMVIADALEPEDLGDAARANGESEAGGAVTTTGSDGGFAIDGARPGPTRLRAWADGFGPARAEVEVFAGGTAGAVLVLPPGATLRGTVRDERGEPVAGASVASGDPGPIGFVERRSGSDGRYELTSLPAGELPALARRDRVIASANVQLQSGAATTWDPVLASGRVLRGRVVDGAGRGLPRISLQRQAWRGKEASAMTETDADGRFAFFGVGADTVQVLEVFDGPPEPLRSVAVPPGQDEATIRLDEAKVAKATVRLRLVDGAGRPCEGTAMGSRPGADRAIGLEPRGGGVHGSWPLRPGTVQLQVIASGMVLPLPEVALQPGEARDLGDVVVPAPARLRVVVVGADGKRVEQGFVRLCNEGGVRASLGDSRLQQGAVELVAPPGDWTLLVQTPAATAAVAVQLQQGATAAAEVRLPACEPVRLELQLDAGVLTHVFVRVLVHARDGRLQAAGIALPPAALAGGPGDPAAPPGNVLHLPPGDYVFTACGQDGSRGRAEASVAAGRGATVRVPLRAGRR